MRALRRFTVRAAAAARRSQPLQTLATNLRWTLAPADAGPVRHARPRGVGAQRARPGPAARRDLHGPARRAGRRRRDRRRPSASSPTTSPTTWPNRAGTRASARTTRRCPRPIGYFSMEFGVSEVLPNYSGGLGRARRRPPQGGLRPRRAAHRRRAALPLGLLPPVAVARRLAAGAPTRSLDPQGLPLHLLGRRRRARRCSVSGRACPGGAGAQRAGLAGRGRPGAAAAARLRHRGERRRPARRHRPALRRRPGPPDPPGDPRRHRRRARGARLLRGHRAPRSPRCSTPTRATRATSGLERIRELQRRRGPRLRRGAGRGARRHGVHHAHAGARRHRPVPGRHGPPLLRRRGEARAAARRADRRACSRSAPRTTRACSTWRTWACAWPSAPTACRSCTARCRGACSAALWQRLRRRRGADRLGDQRRARPDLGGPRGRPRCSGRPRRHRRRGATARCRRTPSCGTCATTLRARLVERGAPPGARGVAAARRVRAGAGLDRRTSSTRTCSPSGSPGACRPTSGSR